jgi:hypothetical protein
MSGRERGISGRPDFDLLADEAGNADLALDVAHAEHHDDVDEDVDRRRRGKRLEHLEAELLHRPRRGGELDEPDRQRHRRVLDDVHELRRERRQDDP